MSRFLILFISLFLSGNLFAREFVSSDGRKINGELIAHAGENVLLKVGAKEFSVPSQNFSVEDQQFIKEWIAQNPGAVRFKFGFYFDLKKESAMSTQGKAAGGMFEDKLKTNPYTYEMIVFNKEITDATDIEVHYEIYIDDFVDIRKNAFTKMAVGGEKRARLETLAGKLEIPKIAAGGRLDFSRLFNTEFYIDRDGGKTDEAALDKILGVRIRVMKDGVVLGEGLNEESNNRGLKGIEWQNAEQTEGAVIKK
ncbi:MAG: hypothetical protein KA250_03110 [Verrucomicrobiales bacterium]|jgi:hypothetical protein|nr:hypothetical protein [Verrucomicrobiales bacterium]MBP9222584.1 hypothetical protein [Verrucomicrobiales bacterium]